MDVFVRAAKSVDMSVRWLLLLHTVRAIIVVYSLHVVHGWSLHSFYAPGRGTGLVFAFPFVQPEVRFLFPESTLVTALYIYILCTYKVVVFSLYFYTRGSANFYTHAWIRIDKNKHALNCCSEYSHVKVRSYVLLGFYQRGCWRYSNKKVPRSPVHSYRVTALMDRSVT